MLIIRDAQKKENLFQRHQADTILGGENDNYSPKYEKWKHMLGAKGLSNVMQLK